MNPQQDHAVQPGEQQDTHQRRPIERRCDVAVIGGSAAGLAAALQIGRQRRSVIVVDAGEPRNAPAAHMHGYLGHEGIPPSELTAIARAEVRSYGVEILNDRAAAISRTDEQLFRAELASGMTVVARKVLVATGLVDVLPEIEGLEQHWGGDVIHCPFCHGFEVRDRQIAAVLTHPMGLHQATLLRQLSAELTLIVHDDVDVDDAELDRFRAAGVDVVTGQVRRVLSGSTGRVAAVELHDGTRIEAGAIAVGPRCQVRAELLAPLGLHPTPHPSGLGDYLATNGEGETAVPGLYAAGNVTEPMQQVLQAAADGSRVGIAISFSLADDDIEASARRAVGEAEWDHRYDGAQFWSGNPNGALVAEAEAMDPGRALDVGAGEGGDALWLAERGWEVTANDVSTRALERIEAEADRRGLDVDGLHRDANALDPFEPEGYDLVTAHYASILRTPDGRAAQNLLDAVAPGGTLLIVNHDLEPADASSGDSDTSRPFDHEAYVGTDDFVRVLKASPDWRIDVHEQRPRPAGASSHHVSDLVLRARRVPAKIAADRA